MTDNSTGHAVPDEGAASPRLRTSEAALRHLYDWMAAELLVIADEMGADNDAGTDLTRELCSSLIVGVAEYVSTTKGSGSVDLLSWISERSNG